MLPTKLLTASIASVTRFSNSVSNTLNTLAKALAINNQPPELAWALAPTDSSVQPQDAKWTLEKTKELLDEIFDSMLWAVPKRRRTVYVRRRRRLGVENYSHGTGIIKPKKLLPCQVCGNFMEIGYLCDYCFRENCKETQQIQDAMVKEYGIHPIEHEYAPIYKGEEKPDKVGFKFVEIEKERPHWFSSNLLSRPTRQAEELPTDVMEVDAKKK